MNHNPLPRLLRFCVVSWLTSVLALAAIDRDYKTTPVMSEETRALVKMLEYFHYNKDAVTSADYPQIITDFMADLDPQRLIFTAQDEQAFKKQHGQRIETDLAYLGNIDPAFAIFRVYEQRVKSRVAWIFDELPKDFDLTGSETYAPDRSKSPWPASPADADALWRLRLKFELLQELVGTKSNGLKPAGKSTDTNPATPTDPLAAAKQTIHKRYERMLKTVADFEASELEEAYLTSLTHLYDPHSEYMSADTLEEFGIQMKLALVGIGAVLGLDEDGTCVVREVVPGGPADLSGLVKANDKIVAVAQHDKEPVEVIGMKLRRIVEQIRGAKGSRVHLTIIPHDGGDSSLRRQVTLVRDVIKLNSARAAASLVGVPADAQGSVPVGVITLNLFYGPADDSTDGSAKSSATRDVAELVGKLKTQGAKALVIDLRRNGGGLLNEAISLAGLFIGQRPVVQVRSSNDKNDVFADENNVVVWDGPLAVLTSRFSASSSEIFAGALQNYGRAIIVGDSSTHGKGTVQAVLDMKNYLPNRRREPPPRTGAAKLTVQKFYLPNGASTQKKGITPDLTLPSIDDFMPVGEASLPRAMMWDEIKSTHDFVGKPLTKSFLEPLRQASVDRQAHLEEFSFLKKNIDWFKMKQDQKNISLNLETRRQQKEADDQFKKEMDAERERLAVSNFVNQDVKLAAVEQQQAAAKKTPPVKDEETDADAPEKKEAAKFDIHLRETLRVVVDALSLGKDSKYWADGRPPITWTPSGKS